MLVQIGKSMSRFLTVRWVNREGVSMWLLARTASRAWARCCNDRAVRTVSRSWTGYCIAEASWSKLVLALWWHRVKRA